MVATYSESYMFSENKHIYLILFGLSLTNFLSSFDVNALSLALVWIEIDLNLSLVMTEWILNGFLLSFASLLLISGRISDLFGHKRLLLIGITIFALSSMFAGFSQKGWQIVIWRVIQGAGTALFWPGAQSVVYLIFPKEKKAMALGILLAVSGTALAIGPVVSGLILSFLNWRWIFFINMPICIFSFLVIYFAYHEKAPPYRKRSLDVIGLLYLLIFAFSLIYGITLFGQEKINFIYIVLCLFVSILFLFFYIGHENRTMSPLIPLSYFKNKNFIKSVWLRSSLMFSFIAITFLTAYYLQHFLLLPPWKCGLYFLPITVCFALGSFFGSRILDRVPLIRMIYLGGLLTAIGAFSLGFLSPPYMTFRYLFIPMILFGTGFGMFAPLNNYYTMQTMPTSFVGFAIAFSYMVGLIFSSLSISLCGIFITKMGWFYFSKAVAEKGLSLRDQIITSANRVLSGSQSLATVPSVANELKEAFFFAYQIDMFVCASLILLSFLTIRLTKIPPMDYTV